MSDLYGFSSTGKLHRIVNSASGYQTRTSKCGLTKVVGSLYEGLDYNHEHYDCCRKCFPYITSFGGNVDKTTKEWCRRIGIKL